MVVRKSWIGAILVATVLFFGVAMAAQKLLLSRAVSASVSAMRKLDAHLPEDSSGDPEEGVFFPLFPFRDPGRASDTEETDPLKDSTGPASPSLQRRPTNQGRTVRPNPSNANWEPPVGPVPKSSRASASTVLGWANAQLVPRGRTVGASFGMPAGIEIFGAGPLGLGVLDGDRLIGVDGTPVSDRAAVVSLVLSARLHERKEVVASMARRTAEGFERYFVVLEQPYLTPEEMDALAAGPRDQEDEDAAPAAQP